ncbi:hypothetical protein HCN44_000350 [Aphidius gifuensis]|uniref:JmjC domain-containing protein n=1 Tax=Aphidius gifuensis TaxID=684658 RepID=A0A835CRT2_APHGI|nr:hypothetical protein HCN44_000350 [Aphidius gifuensis]
MSTLKNKKRRGPYMQYAAFGSQGVIPERTARDLKIKRKKLCEKNKGFEYPAYKQINVQLESPDESISNTNIGILSDNNSLHHYDISSQTSADGIESPSVPSSFIPVNNIQDDFQLLHEEQQLINIDDPATKMDNHHHFPKVWEPSSEQFLNSFLSRVLNDVIDNEQKVSVIKAPKEWIDIHFPKNELKEVIDEIIIDQVIKQKFTMINNTDGSFKYETNLYKKNEKLTYNQYHEECDKFIKKNSSSEVSHNSDEYLAMLNTNPCFFYAPNIKFSIFERMYNNDPTQSPWNLSNFKSFLSRIKNKDNKTVKGIHTPFVYCGRRYCQNLIGHKFFAVTEQFLEKYKINYTKISQEPGMFVITHPYSFHNGYNLGPNINEAVNW